MPRSTAGGDRRGIRAVLLVIIAAALAGLALRATARVTVSLVASILIAPAVMPVRERVRRRVPKRWGWPGIVAAMALLRVVTGLLLGDTIIGVLVRVAAFLPDSAVSIVSALVAIFFLTLLILIESGDWRRKIASITHPRNEWRLTEAAEVIAR